MSTEVAPQPLVMAMPLVMATPMEGPTMQQMQVTIPDGATSGNPFMVNTPAGPMQAICPPGSQAGDKVMINVQMPVVVAASQVAPDAPVTSQEPPARTVPIGTCPPGSNVRLISAEELNGYWCTCTSGIALMCTKYKNEGDDVIIEDLALGGLGLCCLGLPCPCLVWKDLPWRQVRKGDTNTFVDAKDNNDFNTFTSTSTGSDGDCRQVYKCC